MLLVIVHRWRARVIVKATDAPDGAVILFEHFVWVASHFDCVPMWKLFVALFFLPLGPCATSPGGQVVGARDRLVGRLVREAGCGFLRGAGLVD